MGIRAENFMVLGQFDPVFSVLTFSFDFVFLVIFLIYCMMMMMIISMFQLIGV